MLYKGQEVYTISMLHKFKSCAQYYDWRYNHLLKKTATGDGKKMHFGTTIHDGIAEWYKTRDVVSAIKMVQKRGTELALPEDDKTYSVERAREVMFQYIERYKDNDVEVNMVEMPFMIEISMDGYDDPTPFLFAGTIDGVCTVDGAPYLLEHKTTGRMSGSYINSFKPNDQVTGYIWALRQYVENPPASAYINIVHLLTNETNFIRTITNRESWIVDRFEVELREVVDDIRRRARRGIWYKDTTQCTNYGECAYRTLCNTAPEFTPNFIEAEYSPELPGDLRVFFGEDHES